MDEPVKIPSGALQEVRLRNVEKGEGAIDQDEFAAWQALFSVSCGNN